MSSDKELRRWVQDRLYALLGFAEANVASYILAVAKKTSNAASLAAQLVSQGLPAGSETQSFAQELLGRLAPQSKGPSQYSQQQKQAAQIAKQNAKYGLLEDEEDYLPPQPPRSDQTSKASTSGRDERAAGGKVERHIRCAEIRLYSFKAFLLNSGYFWVCLPRCFGQASIRPQQWRGEECAPTQTQAPTPQSDFHPTPCFSKRMGGRNEKQQLVSPKRHSFLTRQQHVSSPVCAGKRSPEPQRTIKEMR